MIKLETFEACGRATPLNRVLEAQFEPFEGDPIATNSGAC